MAKDESESEDNLSDVRIAHVDHERGTLTAERVPRARSAAEEKAAWLRERLPKTMKAAWEASLASTRLSEDYYSDVVNELYAALNPFEGALPTEVDAALGAGMSDLIESEAHMPDGGVFGDGGITGGGIFGAEPVATKYTDPAAAQRSVATRANRALLGEPEPSALPGRPTRRLPEHRRQKLLEDKK